MRRRCIAPVQCEALLDSFRVSPGNAKRASKSANCDYRTAKVAWEKGVMSCPDKRYHRPFKDMLLEEHTEVRARIVREEQEAEQRAVDAIASRRIESAELALKDVTDQRTEEEKLVRSARRATLKLLDNVSAVGSGATLLGDAVYRSLTHIASSEKPLSLGESKDLVQILAKLSTSLKQLNDAGQRAMEMSRLLAGEPTSIVAVKNLDAVPQKEAQERLAAIKRAINEYEGKPIGDIVPGIPVGVESVESMH